MAIVTTAKLTQRAKVISEKDGTIAFRNVWLNPEELEADILMIDEMSMLSQLVAEWCTRTKCRVFGFGDFCQIPEVITDDSVAQRGTFIQQIGPLRSKLSGTFGIDFLKNNAAGHLTEVLRSQNAIAHLCGEIRPDEVKKYETVDILKKYDKQYDEVIYTQRIEDIPRDGSWQYITYKNTTCRDINKSMAIGEDFPTVFDKVLLYNNLAMLGMFNGDVVIFKDFLDKIMRNKDKNGPRVCMLWEGRLPSRQSANPIERFFANEYAEYMEEKLKVYERRLQSFRYILKQYYEDNQAYEEVLANIERIREIYHDSQVDVLCDRIYEYLLSLDDGSADYYLEMAEPPPKAMFPSLGFGYCITIHKSQGSEYKNVCFIFDEFTKELVYTAISRAKEKLMIIDMTT